MNAMTLKVIISALLFLNANRTTKSDDIAIAEISTKRIMLSSYTTPRSIFAVSR